VGAGNALVVEDSANPDSTPFVINSTGVVIKGNNTAIDYSTGVTPQIQLNIAGAGTMGISRWSANAGNNALVFLKSRGTTIGDYAVVSSGDPLGAVNFYGADGTSGILAATVTAAVDGTPGTNDMPGRLVFSTTADGGTTPTERARITSGGYFKASNTGSYVDATGLQHEFRQSANNDTLRVANVNASNASDVLQVRADRNTTNNSFSAITYYNDGAAAYKFRVADSGNVTNTNNSYGSISDVKLKQDIVDASSQWDDIKNLRVRKYHWKSDPDGFMQMGLVAQEAELVSPGLIEEHPDYEEIEITDEDGNVKTERNALGTTTKSVKYSVLYMKAVKALQEAMERIETLEAKVAALEAVPGNE
jgi:hypothetical protein